MLDIEEQILSNCLTKSGSSWLQIENGSELDAISANLINRALCRTLYGRLFTFVVNRINESLKVSSETTSIWQISKTISVQIKSLTNRGRNLGILDFFGFESLDNNSFEQLNINYCSERIHQSYIQIVLKYQQDLYVREGLDWTKIDFYDNQSICEMMDKVHQRLNLRLSVGVLTTSAFSLRTAFIT